MKTLWVVFKTIKTIFGFTSQHQNDSLSKFHYIRRQPDYDPLVLSLGAELSQIFMVMMEAYSRPTYDIVFQWIWFQLKIFPISDLGPSLHGKSVKRERVKLALLGTMVFLHILVQK